MNNNNEILKPIDECLGSEADVLNYANLLSECIGIGLDFFENQTKKAFNATAITIAVKTVRAYVSVLCTTSVMMCFTPMYSRACSIGHNKHKTVGISS